MKSQLHKLLSVLVSEGGSDLHITRDAPPYIRIDGELVPLRTPSLSVSDCRLLCLSILTESQTKVFERDREIDLSVAIEGVGRFRANLFVQSASVAGVFRAIPQDLPPLEALGLPQAVIDLTGLKRGLVLVTGPTGSGKSTTLAAMISRINTKCNQHIITIEDPVEHVHAHGHSIVNQREVGSDTRDFPTALRQILRQDPDVVLIGEMRDLETVNAALTVSETGHLVFSTLHTNSAIQSINRMIDLFPPHQQSQVRTQLSFILESVVSQQLLPHRSGKGRVVAAEVMVVNSAISNLIREDKIHQIYSVMQVGQTRYGMQTMNQALAQLYNTGRVSGDAALAASSDPEELHQLLKARPGSESS